MSVWFALGRDGVLHQPMTHATDDLFRFLHTLPVSSGSIRLLVALIVEGALEREVALSNLELGRSCFSHESETLGDQALRKRTLKFVQELEKARVLQVATVKVGKGHGRNKYRVILDPESHGGRQEIRELPQTAPMQPGPAPIVRS